MDLGMQGRTALVVGGNGYIGGAVAARLRAEGATIVVAARGDGADVRLDAADDASVAEGVAAVMAAHGRLDAVVVTAAPSAQTLDSTRLNEPAMVAEAVAGKSLTFLRIANAVLPVMREAGYGRLVGISGQNALITGNLAGAVRNAALIVAAKNLADGLAGTGVTVNTVNPGGVTETPSPEVGHGKPGESSPDQIAALVAFLCSPLSAGISGESIATGHRLRGVVSF